VAEKNTLFYLIGFQRSGTTLLCHLLDKHPAVVCAEEPEVSKRIVYRQDGLLRDVDFDSIKQSLDFYHVLPSDYLALVEKYLSKELTADEFLRRCYHLFNTKDAAVEGAKEVCDLVAFRYNYMKELLSFHGKNVKFVFIKRDIKGVVNSFIKLGFFPPGKHKINNFNLRRFAKQYVKCLNYIIRSLPAASTHSLTFEDLMHDPYNTLIEIFKFLDVDYSYDLVHDILQKPSRGIRQVYNGLEQKVMEGWRKNLNSKQINWLDKLYSRKAIRRES
jgi:hypothetical protein